MARCLKNGHFGQNKALAILRPPYIEGPKPESSILRHTGLPKDPGAPPTRRFTQEPLWSSLNWSRCIDLNRSIFRIIDHFWFFRSWGGPKGALSVEILAIRDTRGPIMNRSITWSKIMPWKRLWAPKMTKVFREKSIGFSPKWPIWKFSTFWVGGPPKLIFFKKTDCNPFFW